MKILVLAHEIPATSNMPGSPRLFNMCRELSARHQLTLLALGVESDRYQTFLSDPTVPGVFQELQVLPGAVDSTRWVDRQVHRIRREPYFITRFRASQFHAEHSRRIRETYERGKFDAIFVDTIVAAQYVEDSGLNVPAVVDTHDCMTLFVRRMRQREPRWWRRVQLRAEERSIARLEAKLSRTFGAVVANSPVDEEHFRLLDPRARTFAIANGVDTEFFHAEGDEPEQSRIVFTGVMSYGPNKDAAVFFADEILPLVHARYPDAEFWVVGKDPPDNVLALGQRRGVHVTGGVPDIRPYMRTAAVYVSPLRYGTGVKNKLLAALAMGKPVVGTTPTIEGLDVRSGRDLLVADEPSAFADAVIRLLEDRELGRGLAESGRAFVRERYSWNFSARRIEDAILEAVRQHKTAARGASRSK